MWNFKSFSVGKIATALGVASLFAASAVASTVNVNVGEEHQVIRGFGGMVHNQWQGGKGLSDEDARLAFTNGDGGIGLNTLRIPVNESSNLFGNEVEAVKSARKYAGDDFLLFATPWKSPYAKDNQHVAPENYQAYTDYVNSFVKYMKDKGMPLDAISIANEPDWCSEWACWSVDEVYNYTKGYADQLRKYGTKVISHESFSYAYDWNNKTKKAMYDKVLNDPAALKNWDILGAHFYASDASMGDLFFQYTLADQKGVERWMTEHYTESQGSGNDWRVMRNTGDQANQNKLDTVRAMDVAYDIHRALVVGNFSQYTWWWIRRSYSFIMDGNNAKLNVPASEIGKITKRGYIMSQFARFIRPGALRVGATVNPEAEVYASAYKSKNGDSTTVVLVNRDYKNAKTVTVNIKGADVKTVHVYTTSESKNAKYEGELDVINGSVTVKMESGSNNKDCIVTLVAVGEQIVIPQEPFNDSKTPWAIPGKIQAEDFDVSGAGKDENGNSNISFYDNDSENHGNCDYRKDTGVDIYEKPFGKVIGYNQTGEWLEYTVNVKKAGDYTMFAYVASNNETSGFQMSIDGKNITDVVSVPKTVAGEGDFDSFGKVAVNVSLPAGKHVLRFTVMGDWMDVDYFTFVEGENATDPEPVIDPDDESGDDSEGDSNEDSDSGSKDPSTIVPGHDMPGVNEPADDKNLDSEKPQGIANVHFEKASAPVSFQVYSLTGKFLGKIVSMPGDVRELQSRTRALTKRNGVYFLKTANGQMQRISVK